MMSEHMQQNPPTATPESKTKFANLKGRKPRGAGSNFIYLDGQMHFHTEECECAEEGCECECDQQQQAQAMLAEAAAIHRL